MARNIANNFNRLSRAHKRYRQTTDGRTTTSSRSLKITTHAKSIIIKCYYVFFLPLWWIKMNIKSIRIGRTNRIKVWKAKPFLMTWRLKLPSTVRADSLGVHELLSFSGSQSQLDIWKDGWNVRTGSMVDGSPLMESMGEAATTESLQWEKGVQVPCITERLLLAVDSFCIYRNGKLAPQWRGIIKATRRLYVLPAAVFDSDSLISHMT